MENRDIVVNQKKQNGDYLTFKVEINNGKFSKGEEKIVKKLNSNFSSDDIYFEKNSDNSLIMNLKKIDLESFEDYIKELKINNQLDDELKSDIFNHILKEIKEIKSYGLKSGKRLYVDYNKERKVKNRKAKELERVKYYYAKNNDFSKDNNQLQDEYKNKIICADSEIALKELPDNCIDLVFTSPPYNFGLDYDDHKDHVDWNKYFDKLFSIFEECIRVLKYGGRIIVNVQPLFSDYIPIHHIISNYFMKNKLIWKGEILWEKNNYNCKYTAWGSWKSPSSPYLKYTWEFLEIFCKGDIKHEGDSDNADITGDEFKEWVYSRWDIAPERNMKDYGHPAMFPENLVERVLKLFSFEGDVIMDPFNGVGSTSLVAEKNNRVYLGLDTSEEYCKTAKKRIKEYKKQRKLDEFKQ